jgi:hypothetical protein
VSAPRWARRRRGERAVVVDRPGLGWSAGAPMPLVLANEHVCFVVFYQRELAGSGEVRVAEVRGYVAVRFGFPNDEALHGHPLWGRGLRFDAAHEVVASRWLAEVRRTERAHPYAERPVPFPAAKHFFLAFHDSCVELLADEVTVREHRFDTRAEALAALAAELAG